MTKPAEGGYLTTTGVSRVHLLTGLWQGGLFMWPYSGA